MPLLPAVLTAVLMLATPAHVPASCSAESSGGAGTLIELFTSEGCSSCPPADRRLAEIKQDRSVVPLALHVDYWDDLGWPDALALPAFGHRHRWLAQQGGGGTIYTPHFFVDGLEVRPAMLAEAVRQSRSRPAQAEVRIWSETRPGTGEAGQLVLRAEARSTVEGAALYAALAENGLSTRVRAGENRGRLLRHAHVVRAWIGPVPLQAGRATLARRIPLAPGWQRARLELSAFVQHQETGRVLQAVGAGECLSAAGAES